MAWEVDGVQVVGRFAASMESSAHDNFKENDTRDERRGYTADIKGMLPVRLIKK
jgi:enoyl-[acyl-carrier protein] reductase II